MNNQDMYTSYEATAVPQSVGKSGHRGFCIDQAGEIKADLAGGTELHSSRSMRAARSAGSPPGDPGFEFRCAFCWRWRFLSPHPLRSRERQIFPRPTSPLKSSPSASTPITTPSIPCARTLLRATMAWVSPAKRVGRCFCANGKMRSLCRASGKALSAGRKIRLVLFAGRCSGPASRHLPIGRSALAASLSARPYPAGARSRKPDAREHLRRS